MVSYIRSCGMPTLRAKPHAVLPRTWCFLPPEPSVLAPVTAAPALSGLFSACPFWNPSRSSRNFLLLFFAFLFDRSGLPFAWLLSPLQHAAASFLFSSFCTRRCFPPSSSPTWPWWALLCRPQEGLPELLGVQMLSPLFLLRAHCSLPLARRLISLNNGEEPAALTLYGVMISHLPRSQFLRK